MATNEARGGIMTYRRAGTASRVVSGVDERVFTLEIGGQTDPEVVTDVRRLRAQFSVPGSAQGVVIMLNRTGTNIDNVENHHSRIVLQRAGFGTAMLDLTDDEERRRGGVAMLRCDVVRLAGRIVAAVRRLRERLPEGCERICLFAADSIAGAALTAASMAPDLVVTVATRGGRPELVGRAVEGIASPVLVMRGEGDRHGLSGNCALYRRLPRGSRFVTIRGTDRRFEAPSAVHEAASIASRWFAGRLEEARAEGAS